MTVVHPDVADVCSLLDAIQIFTNHPVIVLLHEIIKEVNDNAALLAAEAAAEAEQAEKNGGEVNTSQDGNDDAMDVDEDNNSDDEEVDKKKKRRRKSAPLRTTIDIDFSAELAPVFAKVDAGK